MKTQIEIPDGKRAEWQTVNGTTTLVLVDDKPAEPTLDDWSDPDIYPVWKDESKPHTLENLDGIHIPVIDGTEILLYPKYKECSMLNKDKIKDCNIPCQDNLLYADHSAEELTDMWLALGSEAALYVRKYDKDLPLPIWLLAIAKYKDAIDALSKLLGGDLLCEIGAHWWSCLRYYTYYAWIVNGSFGYFDFNYLYITLSVLPVSLFKKKS